jgi:hypothetical protein
MESLESFASRVLARTGVSLNDLPRRVAHDGDGMGHIMVARGCDYVCAVGSPSVDEDGAECYDQFELVLAR